LLNYIREIPKSKLEGNVLLTILALIILKKLFAGKQGEWAGIASKAKKWLRVQGVDFEAEQKALKLNFL